MKIFVYKRFKGDSFPFVTESLQRSGIPLKSYYKDELGRPRLSIGDISISHTENIIAIALSDYKVGIDIERKNRKISKALTSIENWTQKECYAKYLGCGMTRELLNSVPPADLITTFEYGDFIISVCSEDKTVDIIE